MSRSFTGCKRCKSRRQKCDEKRPECDRCKAAGAQCKYTFELQWGGRSFSRSRFGAVGPGVRRLEYAPGQFIYTTDTSSPGASTTPQSSPSAPVEVKTEGTEVALVRQIDPFSSFPPEQKKLLHHFIQDASLITSCHRGMQSEICKMLVPMAIQTPSLLYATMALSAIHLEALKNHTESVKTAPDIARLIGKSLEHFRKELQNPGMRGSDALLATARTLCLAEIHSGAIHPNTWRAHVEGARALMAASGSKSQTPFRSYLDRWYRSIVALTALNGNGPPIGEISVPLPSVIARSLQKDDPDYLDDYWGFTVRLADIFRAIGEVAWLRRQTPVPVDELEFERYAAVLEGAVQQVMARTANTISFYPGVEEKLSHVTIREFALCNEAFQHTALIHIYRRVRKIPAASPEVQHSVRRILECTSQIEPRSGLSPWVMLTTPLFSAGCEALGPDRETVRSLLMALYDTTRIPNVLQSLKFLEIYWAEEPQNTDSDWSHFLDRMNFDFIPY